HLLIRLGRCISTARPREGGDPVQQKEELEALGSRLRGNERRGSLRAENTEAPRIASTSRCPHPFVSVDLPAALREITAIAFRVAHADFRLGAVRWPRLDGRAARLHALGHRFRIRHQETEMRYAEARLVSLLAAVERLDGHIGLAVADVLVAIAWLLARLLVRLEQLAEAEHVAIEGEDRFGIERIEREMRDAWNTRRYLAEPEIVARQRHRVALRIVDAHLPVLQVAALGNDRATRIARAIARHHRLHVSDRNPEMMQP